MVRIRRDHLTDLESLVDLGNGKVVKKGERRKGRRGCPSNCRMTNAVCNGSA